jgi:hypothetical protein
MLLELIDQNAKAPLPSDRVLGLDAGLRLCAPSLWRSLGVRLDASVLVGTLAETGGLGEGQPDGTLGFSASGMVGWHLSRAMSVEAAYRFTTVATHMKGAAERNAAITDANRSSTMQLVTIGVTYTR